ncbi:hypothetical protein AB901B6_02601 [Acinetobacter baumannii]|nr:hypothetical protein AB901B6_02601 [Acinetobacter baumannii]
MEFINVEEIQIIVSAVTCGDYNGIDIHKM